MFSKSTQNVKRRIQEVVAVRFIAHFIVELWSAVSVILRSSVGLDFHIYPSLVQKGFSALQNRINMVNALQKIHSAIRPSQKSPLERGFRGVLQSAFPTFLLAFSPIRLFTYSPIRLFTYSPFRLFTYLPICLLAFLFLAPGCGGGGGSFNPAPTTGTISGQAVVPAQNMAALPESSSLIVGSRLNLEPIVTTLQHYNAFLKRFLNGKEAYAAACGAATIPAGYFALANATVTISGVTGKTDANGCYTVANVPVADNVIVTVTKTNAQGGITTIKAVVSVAAGKEMVKNIDPVTTVAAQAIINGSKLSIAELENAAKTNNAATTAVMDMAKPENKDKPFSISTTVINDVVEDATPLTITLGDIATTATTETLTVSGSISKPNTKVSAVVLYLNGATSSVSIGTEKTFSKQITLAMGTNTIVVKNSDGSVTSATKTVEFKPAPVITSLSPESGIVGSSISISGQYFGTTAGTIKFNDNKTATCSNWANTTITCTVPTGATTGNVTVTTTYGTSSGKTFTVLTVACTKDSDCNDSNEKTLNKCSNPGAANASCDYSTAINCETSAGCNDNNALTVDTCSNGGTTSANCSYSPATLQSISVTPATPPSIQVGGTQQLTAVCTYNTGIAACPTLTWTSSDTAKATVSSSGIVTGVAAGNATITASASGITSNSVAVTVTTIPQTLQSISLPATSSIQVGATQQLTAVCTYNTGTAACPTLTWTSGDTAKATVSSSGLVTGVAAGSTTVTASASGITSNSVTVTVTSVTTSKISLEAGTSASSVSASPSPIAAGSYVYIKAKISNITQLANIRADIEFDKTKFSAVSCASDLNDSTPGNQYDFFSGVTLMSPVTNGDVAANSAGVLECAVAVQGSGGVQQTKGGSGYAILYIFQAISGTSGSGTFSIKQSTLELKTTTTQNIPEWSSSFTKESVAVTVQ